MRFNYWKAPINIKGKPPHSEIDLADLYSIIKGDDYKAITDMIRAKSGADYKKAKSEDLDYITPGGTFTERKKAALINASGLISIDIDHINDPEDVKRRLSSFKGMQLIFTSPSNKGVKCILTDPMEEDSYELQFLAIKKQIEDKYGFPVDNTKDISRACFLCCDPDVWISKEVKLAYLEKKNPVISDFVERFELELI